MLKRKIKLLVVDDEKDICKFVKLLFRKKGFLAYSALSGSAAIKVAKKVKPDIVLLDIYLKKGMDGLETLTGIRKVASQCRCIMVTWDNAQEKVREARSLGAVSYVVKPLTMAQLLREVNRAVNRAVKGIGKRGQRG